MDVWPAALVVDDFRTMTEIMCRLLQQIGFTDVDRAHDGPSALEHLRAKRYGLVLSDWEMDPMNGPQLIEEMRRDPVISHVPVILVTAKHNEDHSWLAGGDGYIVKPFTVQSLREKIEEIFLERPNKVAVTG
jgi:two-component system, chemotaxis family, chemotaxis protein CheY